jgi:hypothetical protein
VKQFLPQLSIALFVIWAIGMPLALIYIVFATRLLSKLKLLDHSLWISLGSPTWSLKQQPADFREARAMMKAQMRYCAWMLMKEKHPHPELAQRQSTIRWLFLGAAFLVSTMFGLVIIVFLVEALG